MHKYEQVLRELSATVAGLEPGTRIPTEKQLAAQHGVSAMTVRRALQILLDSGRLRGVPGRGTFVAERRVTKTLAAAPSFSAAVRASGRTPGARVQEATLRPPTAEEADWFGDVAMVAVVSRVRTADEEVIGHEVATLNADHLSGLLGHDLRGSLYDVLSGAFEVDLVRAAFVVAARSPTRAEAALLGLAGRPCCLQTTVHSVDGAGGVPVERTRSLFRADRYEVSL